MTRAANLSKLVTDANLEGTLDVTGVVTTNAGVVVDNITIDGTEIDLSSGNLTIDVAGQLVINSDSGQVVLQDDTVNWGNLQNSSGDFVIESLGTDKDIIFKGLDDSSVIEAMRIDMSLGGFVGIGNAGPSTKLHIRSAQASNIAAYRGGTTGLIVEGDTASYIQMVANKQAPMGMLFDGGNGHNDSARGGLIYDIDTGLSIKSGGSTRWTIDETGNLLPSATSLGVYLGVTSATASNLLEDYEEGTWTPSLSQPSNRVGTWGSTLVGTYTKVGRKVTVHCSIGGSGMYFSATSGYTAVTGFPFAATQPTNSSPYAGAWSGGSVAYSSGGTVYLYASTAYLHSSNSGQSSSGVNSIGFCVTYFVA